MNDLRALYWKQSRMTGHRQLRVRRVDRQTTVRQKPGETAEHIKELKLYLIETGATERSEEEKQLHRRWLRKGTRLGDGDELESYWVRAYQITIFHKNKWY